MDESSCVPRLGVEKEKKNIKAHIKVLIDERKEEGKEMIGKWGILH